MENNKIPGTIENWENGKLGRDERFAKVSYISDNLVNELLDIKQQPDIVVYHNVSVLVDASGKVTAEIAQIRNYGNLSLDEVAKFFTDANPVLFRKIKNGSLFCEFGNLSRSMVDDVTCVDENNICAKVDNVAFNPVEKEQISIICELKSAGGKYLYVFDDIRQHRYNFSLRPRFAVSNDSVIIVTWDIWI